jgi:hypothetical protein
MDAAQKAKFEQRMVLVLLVIFVAALFHTLKRLGVLGGKRAPGKPPGALATTVQQIQQHEKAIQQVEEGAAPPVPVVEYTAEGVRDPLRSLLTGPAAEPVASSPTAGPTAQAAPGEAPKPPAVTIQGIIVGERPQAIIDRTLYQVGDTVQGVARIVAIDRSGVTLEVQGFQFLVSPTGAATLLNPVGGER